MKLSIDHYSSLNLKYNPFSFLNEDEQFLTIIPRFQMEELAIKIENSKSVFVEFYGKKGHGKSTHLTFLMRNYFPNAEYIQLKKKNKKAVDLADGILAIDSFQLLSLKNRMRLLKQQQKLIITSHYPHRLGNIFLKEKRYLYYNFNKLELDLKILKKIVASKIELAILNKEEAMPIIKDDYLRIVLKKYRGNIRAIQADLYTEFLSLDSKNYEI